MREREVGWGAKMRNKEDTKNQHISQRCKSLSKGTELQRKMEVLSLFSLM